MQKSIDYVEFNEEKFHPSNGILRINNKNIRNITDLKNLNHLTTLKQLDLSNNQIHEINGLENLANLIHLELKKNKITEIKGLEKLEKLTTLILEGNNISEIKNLTSLKKLEYLDLSENPIGEIKGLDNLVNLKTLIFYKNQITEINSLQSLTSLEVLHIEGNSITEIKGLENLSKLKTIFFDGCEISKIENLDRLVNLERLELPENKIADIEGLDKLKNLKELNLNLNQIKEIKGLDGLINLISLSIESNKINQIKALNSLSKLKSLYLGNNSLSRIQNLLNLQDLEVLVLSSNNLKQIENLEFLLNLKDLDLSDNRIIAIKNLDLLLDLEYLNLSYNKIEKIEGLENLKKLKKIYLEHNNFKGLDEYMIKSDSYAIEIVEYCQKKKDQLVPKYTFYDPELTFKENLNKIKEILDSQSYIEICKFGSYLENQELKDMQKLVFNNQTPKLVELSKKRDVDTDICVYLIQLHSLKGIEYPKDDKLEYFKYFLGNFWDKKEIEINGVLIYNNKLKNRINEKIQEILDLTIENNEDKPNIIIFPENSLPYSLIPELRKISEKYQLVIVGGLEHKKEKGGVYYINQSIVIDKGKEAFQTKQTPVRIKDRKTGLYLEENIRCVKIPKIQIFKTSIGNIAILICKDFLRLHDSISKWTTKNKIDFLIIPSLTSKVLPFHSKLLNLYNQPIYEKLKIIFSNIAEYGGSEVFSIDQVKVIEENFKINLRDNIGEIIVIRDLRKKLESKLYSKIGRFISNYGRLEKLLLMYSKEKGIKSFHIKIPDFLLKNELLMRYDLELMNSTRRFRNSLVHGVIIPTESDLDIHNQILTTLIKKINQNL